MESDWFLDVSLTIRILKSHFLFKTCIPGIFFFVGLQNWTAMTMVKNQHGEMEAFPHYKFEEMVCVCVCGGTGRKAFKNKYYLIYIS